MYAKCINTKLKYFSLMRGIRFQKMSKEKNFLDNDSLTDTTLVYFYCI